MKSTLLIAPDLGLEKVADEVRAVSLSLGATPLTGKVTRSDIVNSIGARQWDIVWLATHGNETGVMLSDGSLTISDLTAIIRNTSASLVVLNTCSSRHIGLELHEELGVDVICTQADANDVTAYQAGTFLAKNLAKGLSNRQAFERSRPGQNVLYYLFDGGHQGKTDEDTDGDIIRIMRDEFSKIYHVLDDLKRDIDRRMSKIQEDVEARERDRAKEYRDIDKRLFAIEAVSMRFSPLDKLFSVAFFLILLGVFVIYLWSSLH